MTQCADILEQAFYEAGLVMELQHPSPTQMRRGMVTLKGIVEFLCGGSAGEYLNAWPLGNFGRGPQYNYLPSVQVLQRPPLNAQLIATNMNAMTVYLPVNPSDGARFGVNDPFGRLSTVPITLDGNGRTIGGAASVVVNADNLKSVYFYRDDLADWKIVTPLLITDDLPFPEEYDQMFLLMMAMRLNPVYGRTLSGTQNQWLKEFRQQFTARYVQSSPLQINPDLGYATRQSYSQYADAWFGGANTETWDRGGWWGWWGA